MTGRWEHELGNNLTGPRPESVQDMGGGGTEGKSGDASTSCEATGAVGNPIIPSTGNKIEREVDFATAGTMPLALVRTWNQHATNGAVFGSKWRSNFDYALEVAADGKSIVAVRPDGARIRYVHRTTPSVAWWEDRPGARGRIVADGNGGHVLHGSDHTVETYGTHRRITSHRNPRGVGLAFDYRAHANGFQLLERVRHTNGRSIQFTWTDTPTGPRMTRVLDPAGHAYTYAYDAYKRLQTASQPGTPGTTITYHYPATDHRLLGKSLNGVRYSTFAYGAHGRATRTEHAGGADRHTLAYTDNADGTLSVEHVNPLGKRTTSRYRDGKLLSVAGHASAACASAYREISYDANGHPDLAADFAGNFTDYDHDPAGLLLRKVEAVGKPEQRTTTYEWDANGRTTRQTLVGVARTDYTYRADGLLSRATTTNLSSNGVANQARSVEYRYTFHSNGLLATVVEDGPRAGTGDAITQTFDATGQLVRRQNALGHATRWEGHNIFGQPAREIDPNGAVVDRTYDARGRLLTETRHHDGVAHTTRFTYDNRGNLASSTTPDGVRTAYAYDALSRLVEITRDEAAVVAPMSMSVIQDSDPQDADETHHFLAITPYARPDESIDEDAGVPATRGAIDSVVLTAGNATLRGWACTGQWPHPVQVHLYVGAPAGIGQFAASATANQSSEPAIGAQCGVRTTFHRYAIALSETFRNTHANKALYAYGISPNAAPNALLANSGIVTVPAVIDGAAFVAQQLPTNVQAGSRYAARVQMRNTGNTVWSAAKAYRLGSQEPNNNTHWGVSRAYLTADVAPGQTATFDFTVTAPATAGTHGFRWRMVRESVAWFGAQSTHANLTVHPMPREFQRFSYNANSQVVLAETGRIAMGLTTVTRRSRVTYDELGRLRVMHGNAGQSVTTAYDANDNPISTTNARGHKTEYRYDALSRVIETIDAANGRTRIAYDAADRVVRVTDPRNLVTTYVHDGFGQTWAQHSPDSGTTTFQYDAAGQRTLMTRADKSTLMYQYDTLGRVTLIGTNLQTRRYTYDTCSNGKGRLCVIANAVTQGATNQTKYAYAANRALASRQQLVHGVSDQVQLATDGMGRGKLLTFPSGTKVRYSWQGHKLAAIHANPGSGERGAVTAIEYDPFSAPNGWTYGNGLARDYTRDLDGRILAIVASDGANLRQKLQYQYDNADRITGITNGVDASHTAVRLRPGRSAGESERGAFRLRLQRQPNCT